jgi:hypothetical protein
MAWVDGASEDIEDRRRPDLAGGQAQGGALDWCCPTDGITKSR